MASCSVGEQKNSGNRLESNIEMFDLSERSVLLNLHAYEIFIVLGPLNPILYIYRSIKM